jgi:hypothetical protein
MPSETDVRRLRGMLEAAGHFGLTDEEIWSAVIEVCDRVPPERPAVESMDELADALARRIEEKG